VHNDLPFGRAHAPPPYAAALFQEQFKNRKLLRHGDRSLFSMVLGRSKFVAGSMYSKSGKLLNIG
jgi:hypothetical protein